uniref:Transmembrane protein 231 n=1 Tax=Panagrellus redivivus TaxID=6233 RepID=A0A7E4VNT2_PANRE
MENESLFDAFCDYTSISGIRFLHSRNQKWFRILSAITLLAILSGFLAHASAFVFRWTGSLSSTYIHTLLMDKVTYPLITLSPAVVMVSCTTFNGRDCRNYTRYNEENHTTEIVMRDVQTDLDVTAVQRAFWITFNRIDPNDVVELSIRLTNNTNASHIALYSSYRVIISPMEIRETTSSRVIYDVSLVPRNPVADYSVQIALGFGVVTTTSSSSYKLVNFAIDLGSTLSLYFGMTALTLFELVVFFFYGRSHEIIRLQPAPPLAIVYDIPAHFQIRRRDAARRLMLDRVRQQKLAAVLPPIV